MHGMLRHALEEARAFVWGLRPAHDDHDLAGTLESAARRLIGEQPIALEVVLVGTARPLPHPVQNELFRIALEGVTNAVKHARPRSIRVEIHHEGEHLRLTVEDDGLGLDESQRAAAEASGHFGLRAMEERADLIGARLELRRGPEGGTVLEVTCPLATAQPGRSRFS